MIASLSLAAAGGLLALIHWLRYLDAAPGLARSVTKAGSVALLAPAAALGGAPALAALGLALSSVGDWALSRDGNRAFAAGVGFFALAQICYIVTLGPNMPGLAWGLVTMFPLLALLLLVLLALATRVLPQKLGFPLRFLMVLYGALLVVMAALAVNTGDPALAAGGLLFLVSDLMIVATLFDAEGGVGWLRHGVWLTYWPAQALLAWGFG